MGSLQERAVTLINQPPSARTEREVEMVLPWLQKRSKLLMELERDTLNDILRHCTYEKATTDDVILKQGEVGDKFYVMLTGRVSVYIVTRTDDDQAPSEEASPATPAPSTHTPTPSPATTTPATTIPTPATSSPPAPGDGDGGVEGGVEGCVEQSEASQSQTNDTEGLDRTAFGKFIMHYEAGTSFGEIALMSAEARRNATIIADMDSDLLVIDRALFNRSVKAKEEAAYQERVDFIQCQPLFSSWTDKLLRLLEMSLRKEVHPFGSVLIRQGQPAHGLVFILSGQVRVSMEPSRHESQYPSLLRTPAAREKTRMARGGRTHAQIEVRRQGGYAAAEQRVRGRSVDLCCLEKNEIFGDTEMVLDLDTNLATLVSTAPTQVLVLNAKNYDRLVARKHPHTLRLLLHHVCQKLAARLHGSKASQLPILSRLHATATARQRHLQGAHRAGAARAKGSNRQGAWLDEDRILLRLFLEDKAPLIKPCVPDSLHHRQAAAVKRKVLMNSPYAKLRTLNMLNTYTAMRRKVPRSILQLKGNVKAERELLGQQGHAPPGEEEEDDVDEDQDDDVTPRTGHLAPRPASAAPGMLASRLAASPRPWARPHSANDVRIVPCQDHLSSPLGGAASGWGAAGGAGTGGGEDEDEEDTLDQGTVSEIFLHMEAVQRSKAESRLRVAYTNTARAELRSPVEREAQWSAGGGGISVRGYEELYQDSFYDWETSDGHLRHLEARVAAFCGARRHRQQPPSLRSRRPAVAAMKRFQLQDPSNTPLAGGTVFVHQKPCRYTPTPTPRHPHRPPSVTATKPGTAAHSHVRRFMLQRDTPSYGVSFGS